MECECLKIIFDAGASLAAVVSCILSYKAINQTNKTIKQTEKQMELSNKQELFDKRIKLFLVLNEFINCCEHCKSIKIDNKYNEINAKDILITLLSNSYLNDVKDIITEPKNNELHSKFNEKLNFIDNQSITSSMLFSNEHGEESKIFFDKYRNFLNELYVNLTLDNKNQQENLSKSQDELYNSYNKIVENNYLIKMSDEIRLK